jgi:serine/threonine-protein kinase RsbW
VRLAIRVAGTREGLRLAVEAFDGFCAQCGLARKDAWELQVALDEVVSNSINHGCAGRPEGFVEIVFELKGGTLEVTVVDDGPAFDPLSLPAPDTDAPIDARRPGGLGVYLVKRLTDRADYDRLDNRNRFVFARRVAHSP